MWKENMIKTHTQKKKIRLLVSTKNRYKWRSRMFRTMFKTRDKLDNIRQCLSISSSSSLFCKAFMTSAQDMKSRT